MKGMIGSLGTASLPEDIVIGVPGMNFSADGVDDLPTGFQKRTGIMRIARKAQCEGHLRTGLRNSPTKVRQPRGWDLSDPALSTPTMTSCPFKRLPQECPKTLEASCIALD